MKELWIVTFIWAFSFNLIGQFISPFVDPYFAVLFRSLIGFLIFLPFIKRISFYLTRNLMLIGAFQFGLTYILLYQSYHYLTVPEVVLFTITTPIFVAIIDGILQKKLNYIALISSLIAVIGAFIIRYDQITDRFIIGLILLQAANISFACGQVYYRHISQKQAHIAYQGFAYFFLGASLTNLIAFLILGNFDKIPAFADMQGVVLPPSTWFALLFVGIIATGLGQYLWCIGAKKVSSGVLAVMNNAVIPIGILINMIFWNTDIKLFHLIIGSSLMIFAFSLNFSYRIK